jgi:ribonuclease PH
MNVVMTGSGEFVELQGTGEETTFSRSQLDQMLGLAESGIKNLLAVQRSAIGQEGAAHRTANCATGKSLR